MGVHHWPGCDGNHPLGTGCHSPEMDRRRAQLSAEAEQIVVRRSRDVRPILVFTVQEDMTLRAGQTVALDPATGMLRPHPADTPPEHPGPRAPMPH